MKKMILKAIALLLVLCAVLPLAACGKPQEEAHEQTPVNAGDLVDTLLQCVQFDTELTDAGDSAALFFQNMPEYALVTMYSGSGYFADELVWITLAQEADAEQALSSVDAHIAQVREQFQNYIPEELDKIDNAVIWNQGAHIIVCITNDYENAAAIIKDPSKAVPVTTASDADTTEDTTEPETTVPDTTAAETTEPETTQEETKDVTVPPTDGGTDKVLNSKGYPAIVSVDQSSRDCGAACIVDNMAYEYYGYDQAAAEYYAGLVGKTGQLLEGQTNVYSLIIPTAIGIVFPDNLVEKYSKSYELQDQRMEQIFSMMDDSVIRVNCFEKMMQHRDEYLYFRTDWHWNGIGAYYAYETFCEVKGITPYTMEQRKLSKFDGYLGALYQQTCSKDAALAQTPDTVYAYHPYSENAYMYFTDFNGNRYGWNIISDVSGNSADAKYYTYAASDQPFAEFYNPDVTDESVAIVVKESFGNVLMSYFVDHYSTVYEIDYRYWSGDLVEFAKEVGADDIIFANNIGMIRSNYLVGLLDKIIP